MALGEDKVSAASVDGDVLPALAGTLTRLQADG